MKEDIIQALIVLKAGGVILYPTDTIWGLGCDATHGAAVRKVFNIKRRVDSKSMLILLDTPSKLSSYVRVPDIAWDLIKVSNSPLTLIYPGAKNLAPGLIAQDGTTGIRITKDPFCSQLIHELGKPIVSTSANISGTPPPACFNEIREEIRKTVDYVVKWRQNENFRRQHSSIIKIEENGQFIIIRK